MNIVGHMTLVQKLFDLPNYFLEDSVIFGWIVFLCILKTDTIDLRVPYDFTLVI